MLEGKENEGKRALIRMVASFVGLAAVMWGKWCFDLPREALLIQLVLIMVALAYLVFPPADQD